MRKPKTFFLLPEQLTLLMRIKTALYKNDYKRLGYDEIRDLANALYTLTCSVNESQVLEYEEEREQ